MSRSRHAFYGVAWLPHLGQGAKFAHQEFLPLFSLFLGSVCERAKGARGAGSGMGGSCWEQFAGTHRSLSCTKVTS